MLPFERLFKNNTIRNLWIYILILAQKGPVYGYELRKKIQENFGFMPGRITSYRVLYLLEKGGFLKSKDIERKKVYFITSQGKKELEKAKNFYKKLINYLS